MNGYMSKPTYMKKITDSKENNIDFAYAKELKKKRKRNIEPLPSLSKGIKVDDKFIMH